MERVINVEQLNEQTVFYVLNGVVFEKYKLLWKSPDDNNIYAWSSNTGCVTSFSKNALFGMENETDIEVYVGEFDNAFIIDKKIAYHQKQIEKLENQKEMLLVTNLV